MSNSSHPLIAALADGQFHTGTELGERLGVSKAAVWKAVQRLEAFGLDVHSVRGKGYRLSEPLTLLNAEHIRANLPPSRRGELSGLEILTEIDSTNAHLLRQAQAGALDLAEGRCHACLAERQTAGRGRRGRQWVSPFGHNLYLSLVRQYHSGATALDGLSLVVGLALVTAMADMGYRGMQLKWPNDVLLEERKLAGILLEIVGDISGQCHVVIGIGVNLKSAPEAMADVDQPWIALDAAGYRHPRRNQLAAAILNKLLTALHLFDHQGFAPFQTRWKDYDICDGRDVVLHTAGTTIRGVGRGVTEQGALQLATPEGLRVFHGGEISLRFVSDGTPTQEGPTA